MSDIASERLRDALQRQRALSKWDNEGGAEAGGPQTTAHATEGQPPSPRMIDTEFQALHVRVIALENLVIALLAAAPAQELEIASKMASYISPRPGFTRHLLTRHAAGHITDLIERAAHFRNVHG